MTEKALDQFMRDYFAEHDEVSVNCRWLQEQLRNGTASNRSLEVELKKAQYQIEILRSKVISMEMDMPQYRLNVKG